MQPASPARRCPPVSPMGPGSPPSCPSLRSLQAPVSAALGLPLPRELESEPTALVFLLGSLLPRRPDSGKKELCLLAPPIRSDKARTRESLPVATDTPTSWLVMSGVPCMLFSLQATPHYAPETTTSERENSGAVFIPQSGSGPRFTLLLSGFRAELSGTTQFLAPHGPTSPARWPAAVTSQHRDRTHSELSHACLTRTHLRLEQGQSGVWTPALGTEKKALAKRQ